MNNLGIQHEGHEHLGSLLACFCSNSFPSSDIALLFDMLAKIKITKFSYSWWNFLWVFILCIVFNATNINSIHKYEGGNESSWCSFLKLSNLLIFVAYCFNVKDSVTNIFCICTIVLLVGKIWWVFYVCVLQFRLIC